MTAALNPDHAARLAHGARLREQVRAQVQAGEAPSGYRARWLFDSAMAVLDTIAAQQRAFEGQHLDDAVSSADWLDVLATARGLVESDAKAWVAAAEAGVEYPPGE
jgi:hypothetical protein